MTSTSKPIIELELTEGFPGFAITPDFSIKVANTPPDTPRLAFALYVPRVKRLRALANALSRSTYELNAANYRIELPVREGDTHRTTYYYNRRRDAVLCAIKLGAAREYPGAVFMLDGRIYDPDTIELRPFDAEPIVHELNWSGEY